MMSYNPTFSLPTPLQPLLLPPLFIIHRGEGRGWSCPQRLKFLLSHLGGSLEKGQDGPLISSFWGSSVVKPELILIPSLPPISYPFGPAFGKNHYYVLIICLWVGERTVRSGVWRYG